MKLSKKQKDVIQRLREGYFLYENKITPGARWALTKYEKNYNWGNINGNVIVGILNLMNGERVHTGCFLYKLNELGKTIEL